MAKTHSADVLEDEDIAMETLPALSASQNFDANRASTAKALAAQPKRRIRLRQSAPGEMQLPDEVVGINGYNFLIQRGQEVQVPTTVYDILDEAHRI